jgi:hypothetical protein
MRTFAEPQLLVPDTGFKMLFFPFDESVGNLGGLSSKVRELVEENRRVAHQGNEYGAPECLLSQAIRNFSDEPWSHAPGLPFIRFRPGESFDGDQRLLGLWVAIETNTGANDRGWLFEEAPPSPEEREHWNQSRDPRQLYVDKSAANLVTQGGGRAAYSFPAFDRVFQLEVQWSQFQQEDHEVDLVIDFGNSRTCALALERGGEVDFSKRCRPLSLHTPFFSELGRHVEVGQSMVSSRFVLKTPEFRAFDPDMGSRSAKDDKSLVATHYVTTIREGGLFSRLGRKISGGSAPLLLEKVHRVVPQMFVKISPVCLGADMEGLVSNSTPLGIEANRRMKLGEVVQQSSAKRYFWDVKPSPHEWSAVPNYGEPEFGPVKGLGKRSLLSGMMLRFQPESGQSWGESPDLPSNWQPVQRPFTSPKSPRYPRSNTLTWSVLSILESAYRQVNDQNWTRDMGAFSRRVIRSVIATYPSGWTTTEIERYKLKWLEAIRIFQATSLPAQAQPIELIMRLDEAVASQLPILYSSMRRLDASAVGENWIALHGRGKDAGEVTVMNIDVGGGTTDVSVVKYSDQRKGVQVDLQADVLFKDSSSAAGDVLVKRIIEQLLIPKLPAPPADPNAYANYFAGSKDVAGTAQRVGFLAAVLVPMAIGILKRRASPSWQPGLNRILLSELTPSAEGLSQLFEVIGVGKVALGSVPLQIDTKEIDAIIESVFGALVKSIAKYAAVYDVDLLMVCGKPSEQPALERLIRRVLPVAAERIYFTKGYAAGDWYPFQDGVHGEIADAKSVTCVGAALERAMSLNLVSGWTINLRNRSSHRNNWGEMPRAGHGFSGGAFLGSEQDESAEVLLVADAKIGRKLLDASSSAPEPVYRLAGREKLTPGAQVRVVFRRVNYEEAEDAAPGATLDGLELVSVKSQDGETDLTESFYLQLYPVSENEVNWQDSGLLNIKLNS